MGGSSRKTLFEFSGRDGLAQFTFFLFGLVGGGAMLVPLLIAESAGVAPAVIALGVSLVLCAGLRARIVVTPEQVVITKSWLAIPYWRTAGTTITDVYIGGDWGMREGASCVVVEFGGRRAHIGSARTMTHLYEGLVQFCPPHSLPERRESKAD